MPESRTFVVTETRQVKVTAGTPADALTLATAMLEGAQPTPGQTAVYVEGTTGYAHGWAPRVTAVHVDSA